MCLACTCSQANEIDCGRLRSTRDERCCTPMSPLRIDKALNMSCLSLASSLVRCDLVLYVDSEIVIILSVLFILSLSFIR